MTVAESPAISAITIYCQKCTDSHPYLTTEHYVNGKELLKYQRKTTYSVE